MNEEKIAFETIAARLERTLQTDIGMDGFRTLLFGWRKHPKFFAPSASTLSMRATVESEGYLSTFELINFSLYAGYDLTKD